MKTKLVLSLLVMFVLVPLASAKTTFSVDCTKGQRIQDVVDKGAPPLDIAVHGICVENVVINFKDFSLHGTDPATDGIQGVNDAVSDATLTINKVVTGSISALSVSNGPINGISIFDSLVNMQNVRTNANGGTGVWVSANSFVTITGLTASQNSRGLHSQRAAQVTCTGCRFEGNSSFAISSFSASTNIVYDSVITGTIGAQATGASNVQVYCSAPPTTPCSMTITARAAVAGTDGRVGFYGVGDFRGQLDANNGGTITLAGSRQLPWVTPPSPSLYLNNRLYTGTLIAFDYEDELAVNHTSQLGLPTNVNGFGRLIAQTSTNIAANVTCNSAGDAWVDAGTTKAAGVTITGCAHAVWP